jgi:hypothetical protein
MPRPRKDPQNNILLQAALEGLELQRQKIEENIGQVRSMLGVGEKRRGRPPGKRTEPKAAASSNGAGGRKPLSASARKRIAAAQKRRWAEYRKKVSGAAA